LLHGGIGERMVGPYSFYTAFATDEEFRIVCGGRMLGTIPVAQMLSLHQRILFGGKTWRVEAIDEAQRTIFVQRTSKGAHGLIRHRAAGGNQDHTLGSRMLNWRPP
jgi:ATP-dependent Lhr-like helicase